MASDSHPNQPRKRDLRDAQARHQSALFGGQAQKPSSQQAETESRQRGQALSQAAAQKQRQLTPEEATQLAELQDKAKPRSAASAAAPASAPEPGSAPPSRSDPSPAAKQLHEVTRRSDLAAEAVASMRRNLRQSPPSDNPALSTGSQSADQPASDSDHSAQPVSRSADSGTGTRPAPLTPSQPQPEADAPPGPRPAPSAGQRSRRPAPTPEELDKLLREMAQRSAARRAAGGQAPSRPVGRPGGAPGAERMEAGPVAEAPPEPPPEVRAEEEKSAEKQAEILRELKAREAAAQRDIRPIPQADQERAEERPVEATVPIRTEGNAVSAAPLHAAIADLQTAMRAHDAPGQVSGVNQVQRTMPNHPLYAPEQSGGTSGA